MSHYHQDDFENAVKSKPTTEKRRNILVVSSNNNPNSPGGLAVALRGAIDSFTNATFNWVGIHPTADTDFNLGRGKSVGENRLNTLNFHAPEDIYNLFYTHANAAAWPINHNKAEVAEFSKEGYEQYLNVNRNLADKIIDYCEKNHGTEVWIHDYQLAALVGMLKDNPEFKDNVTFTIHTPITSLENLDKLEHEAKQAMLSDYESVLKADVITVQIPRHYKMLRALAGKVGYAFNDEKREPENYQRNQWSNEKHKPCVIICPIGIEREGIFEIAQDAKKTDEFKNILEDIDPDRPMLLQIGRLDHTKGWPALLKVYGNIIKERLKVSFNDAANNTSSPAPVVPALIAIHPVTRQNVPAYAKLNKEVKILSASIAETLARNSLFRCFRSHNDKVSRPVGLALNSVANVVLMLSNEEGMGLVAFEAVLTQDPNRPEGPAVIIVGNNTGAAHVLGNGCIQVDPNNEDAVKEAIEKAIKMPPDERLAMHRTSAKALEEVNINKWALTILDNTPTRECISLAPAPAPRQG